MNDQDIWSMYAASHELEEEGRDRYDRFPASNFPFDITQPAVSTWLLAQGWKPSYPNGAPYAVVVSHDIDFIFQTSETLTPWACTKQCIKSALKLDLSSIPKHINKLKPERFEAFGLQPLIQFLQEQNIRSTFYFMSLDRDDEDYNYELGEVLSTMETLIKNGHEIGLHGGHGAYNNLDKLKSELNRMENALNRKIKTYRNHFLRFNHLTMQNLERCGIDSDSTLGFAEQPGFRNGLAHPFRPHNQEQSAPHSIVEIPLIMMDQSFYKYLRVKPGQVFDEANTLIETVKSVNGVLSLLWHNTNITGERFDDFKSLIQKMIKDKAWFCTSEELIEWYTNQGLLDEQERILDKLKPSI